MFSPDIRDLSVQTGPKVRVADRFGVDVRLVCDVGVTAATQYVSTGRPSPPEEGDQKGGEMRIASDSKGRSGGNSAPHPGIQPGTGSDD